MFRNMLGSNVINISFVRIKDAKYPLGDIDAFLIDSRVQISLNKIMMKRERKQKEE